MDLDALRRTDLERRAVKWCGLAKLVGFDASSPAIIILQ